MSSRWPAGVISRNPVVPAGPAQNNAAPGMWRMDEVAYWRKQGLWPLAGVIPDPYFNRVSLLLSTTSLNAASNSMMLDSSALTNGAPKYGNSGQGTFSPYDPNWSNFFDGSGDFLSVPSNAAFDLGSSDFTIECWFNANSFAAGFGLISRYNYSGVGLGWLMTIQNSTTVRFVRGNDIILDCTVSAMSTGTWYHVAAVRNGSTLTVYLNGTQVGQSTGISNFSDAATALQIGRTNTVTNDINGYISNARVVKGTAVYTGTFTPPTANLTVISGTSLLTCQSNRFRDASLNSFPITRNGNVRTSNFSPLAPIYPGVGSTYAPVEASSWSGFFDGGEDYLTTVASPGIGLGTADFTYECWVYPISYNNDSYLITNGLSSTNNTVSLEIRNAQVAAHLYVNGSHSDVQFTDLAPPLRMWSHLAISRVSGVLYGFLNGVRSATTQSLTANFGTSAAAYINTSSPYVGYISNIRITKNVAVYSTATYTVPTAPLTANANTAFLTCQSSTFVDNSPNNLPIKVTNNATISGNNPFNATGYWALGGADTSGATIAQTTATDLGSGDFTVEFWVNVPGYVGGQFGAALVTKRRTDTGLTGSWGFFVTSSGYVTFGGVGWASTYTSNTVLPVGQWNHIAVSRSGTTLSMFMNGVRVATATDSYDYTSSTYTIIKLGGNSGGNYPSGGGLSSGIYGYMSNLRIVKGTVVYNPASTTITVPTSPLTAIAGTSLLTLQNNTLKDNSANNLTVNRYGSFVSTSFNPFSTYPTVGTYGGSMSFDGSGDYVNVLMETNNALTGDFTIECWVYPLGTNNDQGYISAYGGPSGGWAFCMDANGLRFSYGDSIIFTNSTRPTLGMWNHLAVCRSGSTLRVFLNGTQVGSSVTNTTAFVDYNNTYAVVGSLGYPGWFFTGYIADARVSWGALYTSNFTPPTAPLAPTQNTRMLLNGTNAGTYDATAINVLETAADAKLSYASPFAPARYWANYFDGVNDYLTVNGGALGAGSFTLEMWVYLTSYQGSQNALYSNGTSDTANSCILWVDGSGAISFYSNGDIIGLTSKVPLNAWTHIALVRNGTSVALYLNGTSVGTGTTSRNFSNNPQIFRGYGGITDSPIGYVSNLRTTNTVVYTGNFVPSTAPLTAISGTSLLTCQDKTFIDNSGNALTVTANGDAKAGAVGPFAAPTNGTSVYFDGTGDYLGAAANPAFNFGTNDFTVECWLYRNTNIGTGLFESRGGGTGFLWYIDGTNQYARVYIQATADHPTSTITVPTNQWVHLALTRSSGTIYFWMNGQAAGSAAISTALNSVVPLRFGASNDGAQFNGYMSNMRVTNGYARYTSSYTPPTEPFIPY